MTSRPVFLVLVIFVGVLCTASAQEELIPLSIQQAFLTHVQTAVDQCSGGDASVRNDVIACMRGLSTLPQRAPPTKDALFTGLEEFVDCLGSYQKMLLGCPAATSRDADLTALDVAKSLLKDEGALFLEFALKIRAIKGPPPEECTKDESDRFSQLIVGCVSDLSHGANFRNDPVSLLENGCSIASAVRTCVYRMKSEVTGSPCDSYVTAQADVILEIFRKLEAVSAVPDVISRCIAFQTA